MGRKGGAPLRQISKDFGIAEACLHPWLKIADREEGLGRIDRPKPRTTKIEGFAKTFAVAYNGSERAWISTVPAPLSALDRSP